MLDDIPGNARWVQGAAGPAPDLPPFAAAPYEGRLRRACPGMAGADLLTSLAARENTVTRPRRRRLQAQFFPWPP
jgi:hypothetical protein